MNEDKPVRRLWHEMAHTCLMGARWHGAAEEAEERQCNKTIVLRRMAAHSPKPN
jgi:hypothetical protein